MPQNSDATMAYRQSVTEGTTPLGLVVLLYDRAIEDMCLAVKAMREQDVERRTGHVNHAMLILQQLQGTLDFERGGETAKQLNRLYSLVRAKLLEAQIRHSVELMQQQVRLMSEIRECWARAEQQEESSRPDCPIPVLPIVATDEGGPTVEWTI